MSNELERRSERMVEATTASIDRHATRRSPTRQWRFTRADSFDAAALHDMKSAIAKVALPGEPRWRHAAAGDASAAIGIALGMHSSRTTHQKYDFAMTALAICGLQGSAAACVVLSHMIRRLPGAGRAEARIATSWLARAFEKVLAGCAGTARSARAEVKS
jgi:hypothetical protein